MTLSLRAFFGLLLVGSLLLGCSKAAPRTNMLGKGGLPTNQVGEGAGAAGQAVTIPPDLLYPGATEIEGRPFYYQTTASKDAAKTWVEANLPGATQIDADNKTKMTFKGSDWTLEIYDNNGQAVIRYMSNQFLYPQD